MKISYSIYKLSFVLALMGVLIAPYFISAGEEYSDGTLIRAENQKKVYVIFNNKKRWIKNIDVFNSYNFKWDDVKMLGLDAVNGIALNNLVRMEGDTKVYALNDSGYKRHIISLDVFNSYNFKWEDVAVVSKEEMNSYSLSKLIRSTESDRVYFLENNKKRWVNSIESFNTHNFNWDEVHIINETDFNAYKFGETLTSDSLIGEPTGDDNEAPNISNIQAGDITETSAIITWETDESSYSKVNYDITSPIVEATATTESNLVTNHSISLSDLTENTIYYYLVVSADETGNTATSSEKSFTTISSAPQAGENVRITTALGGASFPAAVFTGSEYGLVWHDSRDGGESEIYFTRLDKDGRKIGSDLNLSNSSNKISSDPAIVWADDEYGVVWSQYSSDGNENTTNGCFIYFARLDANGVKQGENIKAVSDSSGSCPSKPSIAWTGSQYGISWHETRLGLTTSRIFFTRLNKTGEKQGVDVQVSKGSISEDSSIAWSGKEFGLIWKESLPDSKIRFARINTNGVKQGEDIKINNTIGASLYHSIVWNGSYYAILWQGQDKNNEKQIYFTKLDQGGNKQLDDIIITSNSLGDYSIFPSFAWTGNEYGLAWQQTGETIHFVRLNTNGVKKSAEIKISDASSGEAKHPIIVWNELKDKYGIIWDDTRDGSGEIYFALCAYSSD